MPKNQSVGIEPLQVAATTGQTTGTNASVLLFATSTFPSTSCVVVKADSANTNTIYVGFVSNISSTNGFALHPRDSISIDWDHNRLPIYVYFAGTAQKAFWLAAA